ncbi:hypothetical protein FA95DRAFT_1657992 [Auriscalpium vulgare]|uniref:Uncharacterized protein n=1 Tax=Auriscalpium vulgare TaxID=40419 RepID=A0ACB8RVJ8_9AGAM|nr:hypothetical protein FA95DRAFT_1657992 [Auriscalpium vulgare]
MLKAFLCGQSRSNTAAHVVDTMYRHPLSKPKSTHPDANKYFELDESMDEINYAQPGIATWALRLITDTMGEEVRYLKSPDAGLRVRAGGIKAAAARSAMNEADPVVSWDIVGEFSIPKLAAKFQKHASVTWQIMSNVLKVGRKATETYRPTDTIAASVISELVFGNNSWTNMFAMCRGIALFGTMAHQSVYRVGSRLAQCVPYTTAREALVTMSTIERASLVEKFAKPNVPPPLVVFDNIQAYARSWAIRLGRAARMITGTGGTGVQMEDCAPNAFDAAPIQEKIEQGARRNVTAADITASIDTEHIDRVLQYHWADVLVSYVPSLALYRKDLSRKFETNTKKHQINKTRHTKVYPLGTNNANEASTKGLKDAVSDFLNQLGITKSNLGGRLIFFHGDGKTFDGLHKMKKYVSGSLNKFSQLQFVRPVLELWHTKWTDLSRICRTHWGGAHSISDPSTLGFMAKAIGVGVPSDFHKVHFYTYKHLVDVTIRGHILQRWEYVPAAHCRAWRC